MTEIRRRDISLPTPELQVRYIVNEDMVNKLTAYGVVSVNEEERLPLRREVIDQLRRLVGASMPQLEENEFLLGIELTGGPTVFLSKTAKPDTARLWVPKTLRDVEEAEQLLVQLKGLTKIESFELPNLQNLPSFRRLMQVATVMELTP